MDSSISATSSQLAALATRDPPALLHVIASTWSRDSHDLFDFETKKGLQTQTFDVRTCRSAQFVRGGDAVRLLEPGARVPQDEEGVLRLVEQNGVYWVDSRAQHGRTSKRPWVVVRDQAMGRHSLLEGDVIKLGRLKYLVRQLVGPTADGECTPKPNLHIIDSTGSGVPSICQAESPESHESSTCRICLMEGSTPDDPMLRPCQCKGSIECVHLGCLRHWLDERLQMPSEEAPRSYFHRSLHCELCKTRYPTYVQTAECCSPLVKVPVTKAPFIVLECLTRDAREERGLHVVSLADDKVLRIGRHHESEVRGVDVSISRCHATIRFDGTSFLLEDHDSKFGTLVAMRRPFEMRPGSAMSVQVGRTVLSLSAEPRTMQTIADLARRYGTQGCVQEHRQCSEEDPRRIRGQEFCSDVFASLSTSAAGDVPQPPTARPGVVPLPQVATGAQQPPQPSLPPSLPPCLPRTLSHRSTAETDVC